MPTIKKKDEFGLIIAEYGSLQNEVLKSADFQHQLINLLLIILGTTLTIGLQPNISSSILFVYPILALLLTLGWINNGVKMLRISKYIRDNIEANTKNLKYHTLLLQQFPSSSPFELFNNLATLGFVIITQFLTLALGYFEGISTGVETVIFYIGIVATVATLVVSVGLTNLKNFVKQGESS